MSMLKLAVLNVRNDFKNYAALVVSLAFTIIIFLNFQNVVYSDTFAVLGEQNKSYIEILIQVISFVLGCFMFFFIWYSTNVFLTRRKKEIGIYVFMGLTNQKIGCLYMLEMMMIGFVTLIVGLILGLLTGQLFEMILLAISDIAIEIGFRISLEPILITCIVYLIIYMIFVLKGYFNIVRSSVLEMVSAGRQNEYVRQKQALLLIKSILGIAVLAAGYYMAVKESGEDVFGNVLAAVVLVVAGVYLLFGGMIPLVFQNLVNNKKFLYRRERALWMNSMVFRIKKNYRTYAVVSVLMLCSITALATGFAMKVRYENIVKFRNVYSFQFLSSRDVSGEAAELIEKDNEIAYDSKTSILQLDESEFDTKFRYAHYAIVSYSEIKELAEAAEMEFTIREPEDDEIIGLNHLYLLSMITDRSDIEVTIHGKSYRQITETNDPYLGYLQEILSFYIVNDAEYQKLLPLGMQYQVYNCRIADIYNYEASLDELDTLVSNTPEDYTARVTTDPYSRDVQWVEVLYSICIFMFMVFVLASGSILFMKLYNDAYEEKERYGILQKTGFAGRTLRRFVAMEMLMSYALPFAVMAVSSYFSVHALEKMMFTSLRMIHLLSLGIILILFIFCYWMSVYAYYKNAKIEKDSSI